jgi:hypothetical protein
MSCYIHECYMFLQHIFLDLITATIMQLLFGTYRKLSHGQPKRGGPPAWGLGERLSACYEMLHTASELVGSCEHDNESSGFMKGR